MTSRAVTFASLWTRTAALAELAPLQSLFWCLVISGFGVADDLSGREEGLSSLFSLLITCSAAVAHYSITRALIRGTLPGVTRLGGFGTFFILSIVAGLGTALGLILFILSGLYLLIRWSACVPAAVAEDLGVGQALTASWRQTDGPEWPILLLLLAIWVPGIILGGLGAYIDRDEPSLTGSILLNFGFNLPLIVGWHVAVAIYLSTNFKSRVEDVFA